jgi:hypothetical protein
MSGVNARFIPGGMILPSLYKASMVLCIIPPINDSFQRFQHKKVAYKSITIRLGYIAVNILIPYPGTEFYKKFEREGRIICTDYTKYNGSTVIIKPKNMTAEQLQASYKRFTRDYYKIMEIV